MLAALRILFDVLAFRVKKLEMANLAAAVAVMLALRLSLADLALRTGYALLLNLLVYLNNDYHDVEQDLGSERDGEKAGFLKAHLGAALGAQLGLGALLVAVPLLWNPSLLVCGVAGTAICVLYSARFKRVPFADVAAMTAWGVVMPLAGVPLGSTLGWCLLAQLGLFSTCFELIQVLRDHDDDARVGVQTTAVRLGPERTRAALLLFLMVAAAYAVLVLHRFIGLGLLVAPLIPFDAKNVGRYWTRVRLVLGLSWLAILAWVFLHGRTFGLLASVGS